MAEITKQFETIDNGLLVRAPGKINISLLVKGKRADGYHDIESIMAKVDVFDEIVIEKKTEDRRQKTEYEIENTNPKSEITNNSQIAKEQISGSPADSQVSGLSGTPAKDMRVQAGEAKEGPEIELICKGPYKVPEGAENLVYKAAKLILDFRLQNADIKNGSPAASQASKLSGISALLRITLTKNMPAGSGLGSGSSDAAATLLGINKFLKLGLSKKELVTLAAKLGSDVAFFLNGPMAICTGRGEKVKKIQESEFRVFLFVPNVSSSTKRVYENYRHDEAKFDRLREEINLYIAKKRIDFICGIGANMLQESCFELYKELAELKKRIESLGIRPVALSGSGSAMFCIVGKDQEGTKRDLEGEESRDRLEKETGCKIIFANNNSW